ncbi:MAG: nucleoside monophosphate kinase [Clostridia bacterium]|nr:nucleoside monophosphate kinase [Clostridia bacterium]
MILIMLGAPGAGKGTLGKKLSRMIGARYIASGDVFRKIMEKDTPQGNEIKKYMEKGKLVPDDLAIEIFMSKILPKDLTRDILLDGYPRTKKQAEHLDKILEERKAKVTAVVSLDVSNELIIDRLINRRICPECGEIYNLKYGKRPKQEGICDSCGTKLVQRIDDNEETIKDRLTTYEITTKPLITYYKKQGKLKHIEAFADTSVEELVQKTLLELAK